MTIFLKGRRIHFSDISDVEYKDIEAADDMLVDSYRAANGGTPSVMVYMRSGRTIHLVGDEALRFLESHDAMAEENSGLI